MRLYSTIAAFILPLAAFLPAAAYAESSYDVLVSAGGESARIEGASFAVDDFSRFEKGSNQERGGAYIGYNYYTGSSAGYAAAVQFDDRVLVYIPPASHGLCDVAEPVSTEQLQAYFCALDEENDKGGALLADVADWVFTSESVFVTDDIQVSFCLEAQVGKFYLGVIPVGDTTLKPNHVDIASIVAPDAVDITPAATGIAALGEFLAGIDYSPLWVTLKTTGCAIVIIFVLGLVAAYATMRMSKRAQDIFDTLFTIPMVLPPTVCGFLLLLFLGRNTAVGQWFIDIGFPLIFSWPATVIAATVVAFPLMYRSCRGAFENLDPNMLDAARTLGWSNRRIFFKLMIPLTWSSIAAATVLAFARALGEFGATLFLAGNYVGITRTIPIAIYFEWMSGNTDVAIFWTVVILLFSFAVILFINLWGRRTTRYRQRGED